MRFKKSKTRTVIFLLMMMTSLVFAVNGSWGDLNAEGVRESSGTELYNPARYAFDGNEETFWNAESNEKLVWAERYWEAEKDISGVKISAELKEGSRLSFFYEKEGCWIPFENGFLDGPLYGNKNLLFTEEQRLTKKILITLESQHPGEDYIYEINFKEKADSSFWGKILPERYEFNQKEYINLKPQRLWDGYIKENWYEPLWYIPYEIQQTREYKSGIFAPYNGNPPENAEIIWELDGEYNVDLIKAYFEAAWRNVAFEFWDGKKWTGKKEFRNNSKTGWNRIEIEEGIKTNRIRITFPDGWENARLISQIEIWGRGIRKNTTENILFTQTSNNIYEAVIEGNREDVELELITEGKSDKPLQIYINENEYNFENAEFVTKKQKIYRIRIKDEDLRKERQIIKVITGTDNLKQLLIRKNSSKNGRIELNNKYTDRYRGTLENIDANGFEKTIVLDRKYEIEKVFLYTENGASLRISTDSRNGDYYDLLNEGNGKWSITLKGKEAKQLYILSDSEFEIDEAEIYTSPVEDKECAVEIWSNENDVDQNSCIIGWKGSRESQITIDENIKPRQEGSLFWLPVKDIKGNYLEKQKHTVRCSEGSLSVKKKYYVNPNDNTNSVIEHLKKYPLLLSIDIPYGSFYTQSDTIEINGRYGNGYKVKLKSEGKDLETFNGRFEFTASLTEGQNSITVTAQDATGRKAEKTITIFKDSVKPQIEIINPHEEEYINTGKAEFCIDGKEDSLLWWQFNDEEWERGYGNIKYKDYYLEDGFYTYSVRAQDRSGNISDEKKVSFCMDKTKPESFNIEMNVSGWTNNNRPKAVFRTTDNTSGIDHYEYKTDNGEWKICTSPLQTETLEDGKRILSIRAYDKAGNFREETTELFIDTSIPPEPDRARPVAGDRKNVIKWIGKDDNSTVNGKIVEKEGGRSYKIEREPAWENGEKYLENYGYGELRFEDNEVKEGEEYSYRMWSVDRAGNESLKTEWKSVITGLASAQIENDKQTVIEYDGMTVTLPEGAVADDVIEIQIQKAGSEALGAVPVNETFGSTYLITVVRQKGEEIYITAHADLIIPAVIEVSYKPSLLPEGYSDSDIAAFYYDDIWGRWLQFPESYVNTKNQTVLFRTEHFSEFNVQATKKAVLSEAQLREGAYKLKSEKIGPSEVTVSGEDGGVSYEFTEYIMPGKAGMNLPIQRVYSTSKAYSDAVNTQDDSRYDDNDIDGEAVWNIADGWKINMPYIKINGDSIVMYGTQGQCFTSGQMRTIKAERTTAYPDANYHVLMECNEYSDVRVDLLFDAKEKINWITTIFLPLGRLIKTYTAYNFVGAVLHQSDGKKIFYDVRGRVKSIEDCTGKNKIKFTYDKNIRITDTLGNIVEFEKDEIYNLINSITTGTNKINYEKTVMYLSGEMINNPGLLERVRPKKVELISSKDIAGRTWTYSYERKNLISKSELIDPPADYTQSKPKEYDVTVLSSISGKGIGFTKIEYEVRNDLSYKDIVKSDLNTYSYNVTQGKLHAKKKIESLTENNVLRETVYTIEYSEPEEHQLYVKKSTVNDGNITTETEYGAVFKKRLRLSNAPEAIRNTWALEEYIQNQSDKTGDQEKNKKQVLTYASKIRTYKQDKTPVQNVSNEIDEILMRIIKVRTEKGNENYVTDEYKYYRKNDVNVHGTITDYNRIITNYNGNITEEKHVYETDGNKSQVIIKRDYSEPVNNRINLVTKMTKTVSGFVGEEEKTNIVTESYGYDIYGQCISKDTAEGRWSYAYQNGELTEVTSPEKRLTLYSYDYSEGPENVYTITTTRKSGKENLSGTNEVITETKVYDRKTGNLKKETDADGYVSEYDYDVLGRLISSKKNNGVSVISAVYDDENLTTKVTDELGCITTNKFDNLGRLEKVSKTAEDKTITVLLEYDSYDRVIKMSEPSYQNASDISETDYSVYEYDNLSRLIKTTGADGKVTLYTYNDILNMTEMDKGGVEKTRIYKDNLGNVIKTQNWVKENIWNQSRSWYDGEGKTLCTEDAEGNRTLTGYNSLGLVQTITCPDSLVETRKYDADGILYGIQRSQNKKMLSKEEYELDCFGRTACRKVFVNPEDENSKKVVERYAYDKRGNVTEETICYENDNSDVRTIKKEYDWAGNVTKQTDGEGNITDYEYDARGNLIKLTDPRENNTAYNGEYFMQMEYDKFGRLIKGWIPHAQRRSDFSTSKTPADVLIEYDAQGNVIRRTDNTGEAAEALVTEYEYTKAGYLKSETCGSLVTKYEYDDAYRLIKTTDANGIVTKRSYDGSGRLISENLEGENTSVHYEYYANGTVKSKTDRKGNVTAYKYDSMNRLTEENISGLLKKTCGWDGLGRRLWENDGEKNLRKYEYDGLGRLIKETTTDNKELLYKYDARGNITEYIDGSKTKFERKYTKTDLLEEEKAYRLQPDNTYLQTSDETRNYEYDEAGFLKKAKDTHVTLSYNHNGEQYESDAYGNIRSMKWSTTGLEMKYDYDLLGRTTGVTTPDGKQTKYSYDRSGLLTAMSGFVKGNIKYETNKSRIQSYTFGNGIAKTFKYNSLGNISSIEYSEESKNIKTGFSYLYDNNYNITSRTVLDTAKTSWFTYDAADRLTQSQLHGAFETCECLENGNLSQIDHDLDGTKEAESYFDVIPQDITLDSTAHSFIYDFGNDISVNRIELFPDSYTHRVRERDIRLYYRESENSGWSEIKKWKFSKDEKNGSLRFAFNEAVTARQIKIHCTWDDRNFLNVSIDSKATFKGNPVNLLRIWTLEESRIEDYEYDGNSNRKSLMENGTKWKYEYYKNKEGGNTARVMSDGKWWYTYDENGNRTARSAKASRNGNNVTIDKTGEYWIYTWDLWNRLIEVQQHNAPDNAENVYVEYTYDVFNHRIERVSKTKAAEEKTLYAYGRNGAITYQKKISGSSVTSRSFVYLNNQIAGFMDTEQGTETIRYAVTDIQGSVTEVYDEDNRLLWKSSYTAFGIKAGETTNLIDFDGLYTGCDYDAETGLSYHWNRWRNEDGSTWLSEDPARDGVNWYGYAGQNPVTHLDFCGLHDTIPLTSGGSVDMYSLKQMEIEKQFSIFALYRSIMGYLGEGKYTENFRCDDFLEAGIYEAGGNPTDYLSGPANNTNVQTHINGALENNRTGKENKSEAPKLPDGVYSVFMNDSYIISIKTGEPLEPHSGFLVVIDGKVFFIDNSSGNYTDENGKNPKGGVEIHEFDSTQSFQNGYGYGSFYYQNIIISDPINMTDEEVSQIKNEVETIY